MKKTMPAYVLLESVVRNKIVTGQLFPGDRLPNEEVLAKEFNMSRITVRKALANLESDKLIVRRPARGTFVAPGIPQNDKFSVECTPGVIVFDKAEYKSKLLAVETRKIRDTRFPRAIATFFNKGPNDLLGAVRRVRLLDGVPVYYLEHFFAADFLKHLSRRELQREYLVGILKRKENLHFGTSQMCIESIPADPDLAGILETQIFSPLMYGQLFIRDPLRGPLVLANAFMRSEYFKIILEFDAENSLTAVWKTSGE
ncbi:MAG: GntR family transcriptional regulator [Acidobacteriota bacterium]